MELNRLKKNIFWVVATVFMGALGSGLWDWILSDFFSWLGNSVILLLSLLSSSYMDSIYKGVSHGPLMPIVERPFAVMVVLMIILPLYYWGNLLSRIKSLKNECDQIDGELESFEEGESEKTIEESVVCLQGKHRSQKDKIRGVEKTFYYKFSPIVGFFLVFILFQAWQDIYQNRASQFVESSIDILAPYIDNKETLLLKSKYRQINNSKDYYVLVKALKKHALESSVELTRFEPI